MKTIGIFSDTHGYFNPKLFDFFEPCDELWHAGDWGSMSVFEQVSAIKPLKCVYGNIDDKEIRSIMPEINNFICEGLKVCLLHIGGYPGKYSAVFKKQMQKEKPDIMVCGHSHILKVMYDSVNKILHINPGAAGKHGFHQKATAIKLIVNNNKPEKIEVWEADK
jgi:putative phosphoesterase